MEVDNETVIEEDTGDEVQNVKYLQMFERLHLDNDNGNIAHSDSVDYFNMIDVMMRLMIQLILIIKIISNTCNNMLFCNYVLFIFHLFLSTSCLSVHIGLLFLIAGD